jgi:hypothetical protein
MESNPVAQKVRNVPSLVPAFLRPDLPTAPVTTIPPLRARSGAIDVEVL